MITRHLSENPVPHVDPALIGAYFTPAEQRNEGQKKAIALSDQLTDELLSADIVIISSPMWNFSIPSTLKAWIDHVVRVGRTFKYTEKGPEGLLSGKQKLYIVSSSGGIYSAGPAQVMDHLTPYLRAVFQFLGVTDVTELRAEGTAMGPEMAGASLKQAHSQINLI